jgi:TatD DNase family protein
LNVELPGKPECCWEATAPKTSYRSLDRNGEADVAIIGAGIVGLTTAYLLAKAGLSVAVLESRRIGRQVTGRSTAKITCQHGLIYRHLIETFDIDVPAADLDELRELLQHPRAVAVGETGLDYFRDYAPHGAQQRLFEAQLALAHDVGKPVVIHTRAADADTLARLVEHDGVVILHCFTSQPLLEPALERGWYVSFAGNVTYKNAYELRAAARRVPADRLLAETDSPYLAPQPVRGRRNEPAYIRHTVAALAEARGVDAAVLERQLDENATRVFDL